MRDAFGGVFMIRIMIVIIFVFAAFTAVSFKYAKTFKIKNRVIDYVEQNQILDIDRHFNSARGLDAIDNLLERAEYRVTCSDIGYADGNITDRDTDEVIGYCYKGIVIKTDRVTDQKIIYTVSAYASWDLGVLNNLLVLGGRRADSESENNGRWKITGEAVVAK